VALTLSACQAGQQAAPKNTQQQAGQPEAIYTQNCANCHGGNLQGSYGPSLQKIGKKYSKEEILAIIQKGKGSMPSQAHVAKEDQQKLAEWLAQKK